MDKYDLIILMTEIPLGSSSDGKIRSEMMRRKLLMAADIGIALAGSISGEIISRKVGGHIPLNTLGSILFYAACTF